MKKSVPEMKQGKFLFWFFLLSLSLILLGGCYLKFYPPLYLSLTLFVLGIYFIFRYCHFSRYSPLIRLYTIAFALPFIHLIPYLWFDWSSMPTKMWGMATNPYMLDKEIIIVMAILGGIGICGFALGTGLVRNNARTVGINQPFHHYQTNRRSLSFTVYLFLCMISLLLSWMAAPSETVFQLPYTASFSFLRKVNFSLPSAWMLSYALLIWLFADALHGRCDRRRKKKIRLSMCVFFMIIVYLQLLRGDRACVSLIVSFVCMWFFWKDKLPWYSHLARRKIRLFPLAVIACMVFFISYFLSAARSMLSTLSFADTTFLIWDRFSFDLIFHGTWSAVLKTPLSVAGDYVNNLLEFKWGKTYLDFILSAPPGFWADFVGYVRPIEATRGPAWEMRYGAGGTHAIVVPFMNLGFVGGFFVMMLIGYGLGRIERFASNRVGVEEMMLLGILAMVALHWFWYGEKYGMNGIIMWVVLCFAHKFFIAIESSFKMENRNTALSAV